MCDGLGFCTLSQPWPRTQVSAAGVALSRSLALARSPVWAAYLLTVCTHQPEHCRSVEMRAEAMQVAAWDSGHDRSNVDGLFVRQAAIKLVSSALRSLLLVCNMAGLDWTLSACRHYYDEDSPP